MKGFKPEPNITTGDIARLERVCNAVLNEEYNAPHRLFSWINRITQKLGGENAWQEWFVHKANNDLGYSVAHKFHKALFKIMPPDIKSDFGEKSKECFVSMLLQEGLTLGKDFSLTSDGGFMLSNEAVNALKTNLPDEAWDDIQKEGLIKKKSSCPWSAVEERLGVPFRQNLLNRLSEFVKQGKTADIILRWILVINCGVSEQVLGSHESTELMLLMLKHLENKHSRMHNQVLIEMESDRLMKSDDLIAMGINPVEDVARAAGSSEENGELKGEGINRAGLQRLALVWRGSEYSVPELIGALDKQIGKNNEKY